MAFLVNLGQVLLLTAALLQQTASEPVLERSQEGLDGIPEEIGHLDTSLLKQNFMDAFFAAKRSQSRITEPKTRQLGDIEFSNRYAEYLRSKAKLSSICLFLQRMQTIQRSGHGGDPEKVNLLLSQYKCPSVY